MELATTLTGQTVQNRVREIGINPNHWYAVAWSKELKANAILPVRVWDQEIALYRDQQGVVQAVEDICPHKGVAMHKGKVKGDAIVCPYHGWEFNGAGECVAIPYFPATQKLPRACMKTFPVRERYGIIFLFPGDPTLAPTTPIIDIPEYDDPDWLMIPVGARFKAHYTICNENTMDVFHGYLHENLQGWFDPVLLKLRETEDSVTADYSVSYQGPITKFLGLSETEKVTTRVISVNYQYPNYINSLQGISFLYLMRLPISPSESRSFSLLFAKVRVPRWLLNPLRPVLEPFVRNVFFLRFLNQDVEMIESEYQHYLSDRNRRYVEVNPAIIAVQRLMVRQYDQFMAVMRK
ncbi:MAG: aromatic ring-hydroxylating dioxygenase subunit alpha [Synechococcales bacterium]|nr:aromatic ring-hydroxylating dioxygenase subunit alpha [Synechococcales bacterium]